MSFAIIPGTINSMFMIKYLAKEQPKIKSLQDQFSIKIPSITLDCFVEAPFYNVTDWFRGYLCLE